MSTPPSQPEESQRALDLLKEAEAALTTGDPHALANAIEKAEEAMALIDTGDVTTEDSRIPIRISALLLRANLERERDPAAAVERYDAALEPAKDLDASKFRPEFHNLLANVWTNRGISLMATHDPENLPEALRSFEESIAHRKELDLDANLAFRWGLTAAWMNRAEALTAMGEPENLEKALESYDEALALFDGLPLEKNPSFRTRLAVAWMNRGFTCTKFKPEEAFPNLETAIQTLRESETPDHPEHRRTLAVALMNKGNLHLKQDPPQALEARQAAREALDMLRGGQEEDRQIAAFSFQTRAVLGRTLAELLNQDGPDGENDWVGEATDMVEEALELAKFWRPKGEDFDGFVLEMFGFSCRVYRLAQPHFLSEYVLEVLDPKVAGEPFLGDRELLEVGHGEVGQAIAYLQHTWETEPRTEEGMSLWAELRGTFLRLTELKDLPPYISAH